MRPGHGTADEQAIAAIAVKRRGGRRVYCVADQPQGWITSVKAAAEAAVRVREARDGLA